MNKTNFIKYLQGVNDDVIYYRIRQKDFTAKFAMKVLRNTPYEMSDFDCDGEVYAILKFEKQEPV